MDPKTLRRLLPPPPPGSVGVIGDFCVDVYWDLAPGRGEKSIETGLVTMPVDRARYSPGGAGNIVANLRGIGLAKIPCFGAAGRDPFGRWLAGELVGNAPEFAPAFRLIGRADYHTPVYCKPLLDGVEQNRIDLGNTVFLTEAETDLVLAELEARAGTLRVLIVNEQLAKGLHSPYFRQKFAAFVRAHSDIRFVFDGRDGLDAYPGVTLKINAAAASTLAFGTSDRPPEEAGRAILARSGAELVVTDGEKGCWVFAASGVTHIDAIPAPGPVDTVGAGDSFTAGFAYALANGADLTDAAGFGNACSAVTIRKINCTGVPTPEELLAVIQENNR